MKRILLLLLCSSIPACMTNQHPERDYQKYAIDTQTAGSQLDVDFFVNNNRPQYFSIGYGLRNNSQEEMARIENLAGINGRDPNTGALLRPGVSLPVQFTLERLRDHSTVFSKRIDAEERYANGEGPGGYWYFYKHLVVLRLETGHYHATLQVLSAVPELKGVPVVFSHTAPIR